MWIDVGIIVAILIVIAVVYKSLSTFVYAFAIIDICLRILAFIKYNTVAEIKSLIGKYFPESIAAVIGRYSSGTLYTILMWVYVIIYIVFLYYLIDYFIKKKK